MLTEGKKLDFSGNGYETPEQDSDILDTVNVRKTPHLLICGIRIVMAVVLMFILICGFVLLMAALESEVYIAHTAGILRKRGISWRFGYSRFGNKRPCGNRLYGSCVVFCHGFDGKSWFLHNVFHNEKRSGGRQVGFIYYRNMLYCGIGMEPGYYHKAEVALL